MPIYEYECKNCGNRFEVLVGLNEKPKISCSSCNGKHIKRILSPSAFVFKGSGFYATDYKKKEAEKPEPAVKSECSSCSESGKCPAVSGD